jgi:pyruvate dehydrogenase (quinone)
MPTEVPLVGAAATLAALLPLLERKADRGVLEDAQESMAAWREDMAALEDPDRDPIQPQYLMGVVDWLASDDAILTCDSGTIATCIAFIGDGGLAMLMAELDTAVRYNLPITVIVNNNASLGQIEWEQVVLGYPEYGIRYERSIDFARVGEACGASGVRVERAGDLEAAVRAALDHAGPALVDCHVNPHEPPSPARSSSLRPKASPGRSYAASPTSGHRQDPRQGPNRQVAQLTSSVPE